MIARLGGLSSLTFRFSETATFQIDKNGNIRNKGQTVQKITGRTGRYGNQTKKWQEDSAGLSELEEPGPGRRPPM